MEFLIAMSLTVIALTLAYKLIERQHKILLAKCLGGVLIVGAVGLGVLWAIRGYSARTDRSLQESVTVVYAPDSAYLVIGSSNPWRKYGLVTDTLEAIPFKICNNGSDTITSLRFTPKTRVTGRSTEYDVIESRSGEYVTEASLSSDYVLAPTQCTSLSWSVNAKRQIVTRDTVYASNIHVERVQ